MSHHLWRSMTPETAPPSALRSPHSPQGLWFDEKNILLHQYVSLNDIVTYGVDFYDILTCLPSFMILNSVSILV